MVREADNIDFLTTGRQPSDRDFKRISKWISDQKEEKEKRLKTTTFASNALVHKA